MLYPLNFVRAKDNGEYEMRLLTDESANMAAMVYVSHEIFNAYAALFYDNLGYENAGVREHAISVGILPASYRGSEDDAIKLLRDTAEDIVSHDFVVTSFMGQRVVYGLIQHLKGAHHNLCEDEHSPEEFLGDKIKDPIKRGLREHPEDWGEGCNTYEEALADFFDFITEPDNYEDIFFDDFDFLLMDEFDLDEDTLARQPFLRGFNLRAETDEDRRLNEALNENVDRGYAQEMIARRWLEETKAQNAMPFGPSIDRCKLERRLNLTPMTHLVNMLLDIRNNEVFVFRWVNCIWSRDLDKIEEVGKRAGQ